MPQDNEEYSPEDLVHALTIAVAVLYPDLFMNCDGMQIQATESAFE